MTNAAYKYAIDSGVKSKDTAECSKVEDTYRDVQKNSRSLTKQLKKQKVHQDWKLAIMTVALVIGFFITWLPFIISRLGAVFSNSDPSYDVDYHAAALTTVNSVINRYLVLGTGKDIRRFILKRMKSYLVN